MRTIALFLPKVRQAKDTAGIAFLCAYNDDTLTAAKAALGKDDAAQLTAAPNNKLAHLHTAFTPPD